ncbi:unnamed protein product [Allacma fusca]|uniref:Peptidase S1 domain-containing protein n=1 Tax=Allacma fusca TaxID=39272 RepID=A0A8J2KQ73_9HEXA|nr:unnamed protein product [Allacma fusca]
MKFVIILGFLVLAVTTGFQDWEHPNDNMVTGVFPSEGKYHGNVPLIIGGVYAKRTEFPHQVSIQIYNRSGWQHVCGGSIISEDAVLTAAHCLLGREKYRFRIIAGEWDLTKDDGTEQTSLVRKTFLHPSYNPRTRDYDYAGLKLAKPLKYNKYVRNISLAPANAPLVNCSTSGWGVRESGETSPILQKVDIPLVEHTICAEKYQHINKITDRMVCAGAAGKGACFGDDGGPLQCNGFLLGISSWWNSPCAQEQYPTVFADVTAAIGLSWIDRQ